MIIHKQQLPIWIDGKEQYQEYIELEPNEQVISWTKVEDGLPDIGKNNWENFFVKVKKSDESGVFLWVCRLVSDNNGKVGWDTFESSSIIEYAKLD